MCNEDSAILLEETSVSSVSFLSLTRGHSDKLGLCGAGHCALLMLVGSEWASTP